MHISCTKSVKVFHKDEVMMTQIHRVCGTRDVNGLAFRDFSRTLCSVLKQATHMFATGTKVALKSSHFYYNFCYPIKVTCLPQIRDVSCSSVMKVPVLPKSIVFSFGPSMEPPEQRAYFALAMTATFHVFPNS